MAGFLNNTNDIILDAVLTDYGRQLLAKGDGSFNIVKFAFGDDEIDYSLYKAALASPNQDSDIMSTPVLEAITNNIASLQNKLLTIKQENILFLPVIKINSNTNAGTNNVGAFFSSTPFSNGYVIPVNPSSDSTSVANALTFLTQSNGDSIAGVLPLTKKITLDQGLDSIKLNAKESLSQVSPELYENEYNIMIDSRFGVISGLGDPLTVDDDYMATYRVTEGNTATSLVTQIPTENSNSSINGTKGTRLQFTIEPTLNIKNSDVYFNTYGNSSTTLNSTTFKTLRSSVQITGIKTGYTIDIPILFAKK